jgi:hypothetical protein
LLLPDIKNYTLAQQKQLANELKTCKPPVATMFLKDYDIMQQETRIAEQALKSPAR